MTKAAAAGRSATSRSPNSAIAKDPDRQGPAPEIEGAKTGGTITVYFPGDPGPDSLDPAEGWSVTGNSIQQALTNRSLTQFARDPETGKMLLVPDLAVDLGQPNDDYTEWTFQLRDDATWETGDPVTAEEVAFGITRTLDADDAARARARRTPRRTSRAATDYGGPYTDEGKPYDGVTFDNEANTVTIKMAKPFPDMDYWGSFMAVGPAPLGDAADPPDYGRRPALDRPLQDRVVQAERGAGAGQERPVGPRLRPGPAPVRRPAGSSSTTRTRRRSTRSC